MPSQFSTREVAEILGECRLFSALSLDDRQRLAEESSLLHLAGNHFLFSRNDNPDAMYVLLCGEIAIEIISADGKNLRLASLRGPDIFGELGVIDGAPRSADARALSEATILKVTSAKFRGLVAERPDFALGILAELVAVIRATNDQIENISFQPLRRRVAALLATLAKKRDPATASITITQNEIADRLGATRERVNSHLQACRKAGAITLARGRIGIVDLSHLERLAAGEIE